VRLHVDWFAREVHPWDHDLPLERQAELFAEQCLEDVDAAIFRLFEELPEVGVIDMSVFDRGSNTKIIKDVVSRENARTSEGLSLGMRLNAIGVNYRRSNLRFESIS
jgi:hypothetical protein